MRPMLYWPPMKTLDDGQDLTDFGRFCGQYRMLPQNCSSEGYFRTFLIPSGTVSDGGL